MGQIKPTGKAADRHALRQAVVDYPAAKKTKSQPVNRLEAAAQAQLLQEALAAASASGNGSPIEPLAAVVMDLASRVAWLEEQLLRAQG